MSKALSIEASTARGVRLDIGAALASELAAHVNAKEFVFEAQDWEGELRQGGHVLRQWPDGEAYYSGGARFSLSSAGFTIASSGTMEQQMCFVERVSALVEVQMIALGVRSLSISSRRSLLMDHAEAQLGLGPGIKRTQKGDLLGIAPVQWFGSAFVEAFGGDAVFEGLPDGWAERVGPGLWKVFGVEDPEDLDAFVVDRLSDRERSLIETFGPQFFFNVETGELATEFVEIPIASQYPVYLWDQAAGQVVIHETDGSTRPANLDSATSASQVVTAPAGPRDLAPVVVNRMTELMGDVFVDDDQLYWVEMHLQVIPSLDDSWVDAFSVWLGEHVMKGILDAAWVDRDGRWVVSSSRGEFDPEPVVRATVGSEARGESRVMVSAACEAMGIPLP